MRRLLVVAATTATLGGLGLTATAQAQPGSPATPSTVLIKTERVTAGVSGYFQVPAASSSERCKIVATLKGPPRALPPGVYLTAVGTNGCTAQINGHPWPSPPPSTYTLVITFTASGKTTTVQVMVDVAAPGVNDAVGVGSDTTTPLTDQLSTNYNATVPSTPATHGYKSSTTATHEYSWDAVNPLTGAIGDTIHEKADCPSISRPDGSSAGITQLATFKESTSGPFCTNFARSGRARSPSDPPFAPSGVAFVALAGDAVSWATPAVNTAAPATLTPAQLAEIYTCEITNWSQVGGGNQAIVPFLPQNGSDTLSFWLSALGNITTGPCVSNDSNTLAENEGVNPVLNNPGAIFIYSVGDYIAQKFHSAKCLNTACTANSHGVVCEQGSGKNPFGCDEHGTMTTREISGVAPTTGSGTGTKINPAFPVTFHRTLFNVVPYDPATSDHIPGPISPVGGINLEQIFGASGYDCTNKTAITDIENYGFAPLGANCGKTN